MSSIRPALRLNSWKKESGAKDKVFAVCTIKFRNDKINFFIKTNKFRWYTTEQGTAKVITVKVARLQNVGMQEKLFNFQMQ